ncbi:hypothetical protein NDN01_02670 [Sphingomonas sp. QA11]|uniref:hypothetical protein n=1 Tax=Sphingomonas sp. QA11 TaxID=2950605 RepID=UPI00234A35A4|nr:hypothetical protein [Sphingomonas sp. QA11]WCM27852.1 hypothetical protein NDN01_02670 [Sphingomonas sp. QA11]
MMLFPEDPKQRPQLWDALANQLANEGIVSVVSGGKGDPSAPSKNLSPNEVEAVMSRMKGAAISRISASRGSAIAPHFGGTVQNRGVAITDFITTPSPGSPGVELVQLQNDLEAAALSLLYGTDAFDSVRVPVRISSWSTKDLSIDNVAEGIEFRKAS